MEFFNDGLHIAICSANHAAETARIIGNVGQDGERTSMLQLSLHDALESLDRQKGHIRIRYQDILGLAFE